MVAIADEHLRSFIFFAELRSVQETEPLEHWMRRHPDGRRWIGLKAGTYLVDRAMRASGQSAAELVSASTEEVLSLAR